MRRRLTLLGLAALIALLPACANTVEGLEEDAEQNVEDAQEGLEDAEQELEGE